MKYIIILLTLISSSIHADSYFYKDKELFYDAYKKIVDVKENYKRLFINKKYNNGKISYEEYQSEINLLKDEIKKERLNILKTYKNFDIVYKKNNEKCDFLNTRKEITINPIYYGLWHLNYILNYKIKNKKNEIAIIDGYMLTNKLLPNLVINDCNINSIGCKTSWDFVFNNNQIYRNDYDHTYWISSIIGGQNCGNEKSEFQQLGINTETDLYTFNVSKKINGEYKHSLKKVTDAIIAIDKMNINFIYIPLSFSDYEIEEKNKFENAVKSYLSKGNRYIISVYGNSSKIDEFKDVLPCSFKKITCVGGVNQYGALSSTSVKSNLVDIFAPSTNIIGGLDNNNNRIMKDGVSAAGAIVVGMISKLNNEEEIYKFLKGNRSVLEKNGSFTKNMSVSY